MRKRAQRRSRTEFEETKSAVQPTKTIIEKKPFRMNKKWWIAVTLIGIFFLVLFLNTYFNLTSELAINPEAEGFDKFYLSGPDPYYNMRLIKGTYETGAYPYYYEPDPLLNYPIGARGARAPLFNMMAMGFSRVLTPFMPETEAIGYSMQFVPALFGALIIFVVYFIGKELFNRKAGLIGAFFIAITPIHLGSGHGSAFALFDHDSFNLLLFFLTFLFLIKSIKEKNSTKSLLYAILGGVSLAGLSMTWVEAHYLYVIIAIYAIVQMFIDIFTNKIEFKVFRNSTALLFSGYLIAMPVVSLRPEGFVTNTALYLCLIVAIFGAIYYLFGKFKVPWTISMPTIFTLGAVGLIAIYFSQIFVKYFDFLKPLNQLRLALFGVGIYGNKVSMTIAEANTYEISHTVMSFGPAIYWLGWFGFLYLCYRFYKNKMRREYLFIIVLFIMNIWLSTIAGRFINDMVPVIAVLAGWIIWMFIDWLDYKQMLRNIKSAGGGFHGIRRGVKFLHIFGILFVGFIVVLPNAFVAFDASVPNAAIELEDGNFTSYKEVMFSDTHQGAYGMGIIKEKYWQDAFSWLREQDTDIEDPTQRPAFISWWDYGFYEVALGEHPTVADNFQDGIPVAANFHTATSEKEAVLVWIIRLLEGVEDKNGKITEDVTEVLTKHLGETNSAKVVGWMEDFTSADSYGDPIGAEYDEETSKQYTVGQQYLENAVYHDIVKLFDENLDDEGVTWLYHDLQEATGWSIRYYGVEGYDRQIFNIFAFLSDKSLLMVNGIADDFIELLYNGYELDSEGKKIPGSDSTWKAEEILNMPINERAKIAITGTSQLYKDPYFETMFYKTYIGPATGEPGNKREFEYQIPCLDMKHFYAEFFSNLLEYPYFASGNAAVVIAKYYEGALVNGTVTFMGEPLDCEIVVQKNITYYPGLTVPIDHDKESINSGRRAVSEEFNVLVGADAHLQIRKLLGQGSFIYGNVTFDGFNGTDYAPITDNEAMRRDGYDFERFLNITIEPANISGYVFNDTNYDKVYNDSIDEPFSDLNIALFEITNFAEDRVDLDQGNATILTTDETGYYNTSELLPGIYRLIVADKDGFRLHLNDVALYQGNNTYEPINAQEADLEGVIYFDENDNGEYDSGDTLISNADVELDHLIRDDRNDIVQENFIGTFKTSANGSYSFKSLVPGVINGQDLNEYRLTVSQAEEGYHSVETVRILENETNIFNVSIGFAQIPVSGTVTYEGTPIDGIEITFDPDETVEDNTAEQNITTTEADGSYKLDLSPGSYNISMRKIVNTTLVYSLEDKKIEIEIGQEPQTQDFVLEKKTATVSGTTSSEGSNIENITISFKGERVTSFKATSEKGGAYSVELEPGNYSVNVNQQVTEDDQNYTYSFTGSLEIKTAPSDITYDIDMVKEADE